MLALRAAAILAAPAGSGGRLRPGGMFASGDVTFTGHRLLPTSDLVVTRTG